MDPLGLPNAPNEHQVAVVNVLETCFIVAAFAFMAVFGFWKLVEIRNRRRERLLRQAASEGEPPARIIDVASE
jgi:hypothetical protein